MSIKLLPVLLMVAAVGANAQDFMSTNLTWSVDSLTDLSANASYNYHCTFKTNGNATIQWVQQSGNFTTALSVQSQSGTWADVSASGSIAFNVQTGSQTGTVTFSRTSSGLYIIMDFSRLAVNPFRQRYHVAQITSN